MNESASNKRSLWATRLKWGYAVLVTVVCAFLIIAEHLPDAWRWGEYRGVEADAWLSFWGTFLTVLGAVWVAGWQLRKHESAQREAAEEAFERERRWREATALERLQETYQRFHATFELDKIKPGARNIDIPDVPRDALRHELRQHWETWCMYSGLPWNETLQATNYLLDSLDVLVRREPKLGERMGRGNFYLNDGFLTPMYMLISGLKDDWASSREDTLWRLEAWEKRMESVRGHFYDMPRDSYDPLPQMVGWNPKTDL